MSYCDFVIKKEHHLLRIIFSNEELKLSESICDLETYYRFLKTFIYVSTHLCLKYNKEPVTQDADDEKILSFMHKSEHDNLKHYLKKFQK